MFTPSIVWLAPLDADVAVQSNDIASLCLSSAPPQPKHALKLGTNSLLLHFKSALLEAEALEEKYEKVRAGSCNLGLPNRVYVRKAQFGWRWDWGELI